LSLFDVDFDDAERAALLARRASLLAKVDDTAYSNVQLDDLRKMVLDLVTLILDTSQMTAEDRTYSLGLNAEGLPNVPEYRHEVIMSQDSSYRAAWRYDYDPNYPAIVEADPQLMRLVELGRTRHPYREGDPDIVDRSLLRNFWRPLEPGESMPPGVTGRTAPQITTILTPVRRTRVVTALG
jgi:hypothetical protein